MILKAYKYRIRPTSIQSSQLEKTFGCCRFIYNYMLNKIKDRMFACPVCGLHLDRDLNAAINIKNYAPVVDGGEHVEGGL